ncbi:MAG TPA: DUF1573 domain-containing protein [Bacteroidales bacterium]|nr:DUF1573 domain-containing protein [Bacteroidales bacterium]
MRTTIYIFMMMLLSAGAAFGQKAHQPKIQKQDGNDALSIGAHASWDTTIADMGDVKFRSETIVEFTLTNSGNEPLLITYAQAACGCTNLQYSEAPILPGRATKLKVTYDGTGNGPFMKTITVQTSASGGRTVLQVKGNVVK